MPYKVQLYQELKLIDHPIRFRFAKWAYDRHTEDADFGKKIIFSGETHFNLGVCVNKQICRIWDTESPHAYIEKPTHPKRITVWCGFFYLFFFCRAVLNKFLFTKIEVEDIVNIWFQ